MSDSRTPTDHTPYDALLLLSFGGPEGPEDVVPFLENVTRGRGIPKERLTEVGKHYFLFGGVGLLAGVQDVRVLRAGPPTGSARLRRHLWRMCFALFVAAMSFFLGQADEFPKEFRIYPLLTLPGLIALGSMAWWLWRLRARRRPPATVGTAGVGA